MRIPPFVALLALAVTVQAQDFTSTMSSSERTAAGLDKLTASELAALKAAVERYKTGEVAAVRQEAEQKVAAAEARAIESSQEERKRGYLAGLFNERGQEDILVESTLPGRYQSFQGRPIYTLANGQRWAVAENARYFAPRALQDPKVKVEPGAMGSFWLSIEGGPRLRVKPVISSDRK